MMKEKEIERGDAVHINTTINGWDVTSSVKENGKIEMIAWKTVGRIGGASGTMDHEAAIKFSVETTENRLLP